MDASRPCDAPHELLYGSFTSAVGLALGEMLLLLGRPEDLGRCLHLLETAAYATILSSDLRWKKHMKPRQCGTSLARAALGVVRAWHEEPKDLSAIGNAITLLGEVLEEMGGRYVAPLSDE